MDETYSLMIEGDPSGHQGPFQTIEAAREAIEKHVDLWLLVRARCQGRHGSAAKQRRRGGE